MGRNLRTTSRQLIDLTCVGKLVGKIKRCAILEEFAKPSPGIGEAPGRKLNFEMIKSFVDALLDFLIHENVTKLLDGKLGGWRDRRYRLSRFGYTI